MYRAIYIGRAGAPPSMGRQREVQGGGEESEADGRLIYVYKQRSAGLDMETVSDNPRKILRPNFLLGVGSDERNNLLSESGEAERHGH